jgi:hypothetical protein
MQLVITLLLVLASVAVAFQVQRMGPLRGMRLSMNNKEKTCE